MSACGVCDHRIFKPHISCNFTDKQVFCHNPRIEAFRHAAVKYIAFICFPKEQCSVDINRLSSSQLRLLAAYGFPFFAEGSLKLSFGRRLHRPLEKVDVIPAVPAILKIFLLVNHVCLPNSNKGVATKIVPRWNSSEVSTSTCRGKSFQFYAKHFAVASPFFATASAFEFPSPHL